MNPHEITHHQILHTTEGGEDRIVADSVPDELFDTYTKLPVEIRAVQMDEPFVVETMENKRGEKLYGAPGDYLIRGVEGELYPCEEGIFEKTYRRPGTAQSDEACPCTMRTFHFLRLEDESGTSGTGVVAEGVEFQDGSVCVHWFNEDNPDTATTSDGFSFKPGPDGIEDTIEVHGHDDKTKIVFHE